MKRNTETEKLKIGNGRQRLNIINYGYDSSVGVPVLARLCIISVS